MVSRLKVDDEVIKSRSDFRSVWFNGSVKSIMSRTVCSFRHTDDGNIERATTKNVLFFYRKLFIYDRNTCNGRIRTDFSGRISR